MTTSSSRPFSAVVLAGGRSTRMGADKAALRLPDGQPLLLRQLGLLTSLPADRVLVSARQGQVLPTLPSGVERVDDAGDSGPLGGIVAALRQITTSRLLVVAVDLPRLDPATLIALLAASGAGTVPEIAGRLEPLVAIYPRVWLPAAEAALEHRDLSLQRLLRAAAASGLFTVVRAPSEAAFLNWNTPDDLQGVLPFPK